MMSKWTIKRASLIGSFFGIKRLYRVTFDRWRHALAQSVISLVLAQTNFCVIFCLIVLLLGYDIPCIMSKTHRRKVIGTNGRTFFWKESQYRILFVLGNRNFCSLRLDEDDCNTHRNSSSVFCYCCLPTLPCRRWTSWQTTLARTSATGLSSPGMYLISVVNSEINVSWRHLSNGIQLLHKREGEGFVICNHKESSLFKHETKVFDCSGNC